MLSRRTCFLGAIAALPLAMVGCAPPEDEELDDPGAGGGASAGEEPGWEEGPEDGPLLVGEVPEAAGQALVAANPAAGLVAQPFTYKIQSPINVPQGARYQRQQTPAGVVHTMRVVNGDSAFKEGSGTDPRTEMRWYATYKSGRHMFDADFKVDSVAPNKGEGGDEKGTCIMQILRVERPTGGNATSLMLSARPDRTLRPYFAAKDPVLFRFEFGRWYNLKVDHRPPDRRIQIYIDDRLVGTHLDRNQQLGATYHFKNGAYGAKKSAAEPGATVVHFRNVTYRVPPPER